MTLLTCGKKPRELSKLRACLLLQDEHSSRKGLCLFTHLYEESCKVTILVTCDDLEAPLSAHTVPVKLHKCMEPVTLPLIPVSYKTYIKFHQLKQ